jgi:Family of unknown function (DUF5683)
MGSGGPRGLQILLSGADRVRGGFDSHTFPPDPGAVFRFAVVILLAWSGPVRAADVHPSAFALTRLVDAVVAESGLDSLAADSSVAPAAVPSARPDSAAAPRVRTIRTPVARRSAFDEPRYVMLRSAIVPGWGQWFNRQWVKGAVVSGVEIGLFLRILDDNRTLDDLSTRAAQAMADGDGELQNTLALQYNDRLDTMVARQWLLAGVVVYALLDAYVDAHFRNFEIEFKDDPALPPGDTSSSGVRAGLRWNF